MNAVFSGVAELYSDLDLSKLVRFIRRKSLVYTLDKMTAVCAVCIEMSRPGLFVCLFVCVCVRACLRA